MNKFYLISPSILQACLWPFTRFIFWFFGRWQIKGLENLAGLDTRNGVVFAVNHSSELDPGLVPAALPFLSPLMPMFYTSRERDFYKTSGWRQYLYGGFLFKIWGAHPLNSGKKDYEISLSNHIQILKAGKSLCIFPEGRKTTTGELGAARGGAAYLADKINCPIVPVYLGGIWKMSFGNFIQRKVKITVSFGQPLYKKDIFVGLNTDENYFKAGGAVIMSQIAKLANSKTVLSPFCNNQKIESFKI